MRNMCITQRKIVSNIFKCTYIHVDYIHNWSFQSFSQDYDLVSHTIYVVWVNFLHKWRGLQFKVDSEEQIIDKLFMEILFTLSLFARNLLRVNRRRNTICISWQACGSNLDFTSNKPTHDLLDYGDFLSVRWLPRQFSEN